MMNLSDIHLYFIPWQILNLSLAFIGAYLGYLFQRSEGFSRPILFFFWMLFLPNTIYLITDIQYFSQELSRPDFLGNIFFVIFEFVLLVSFGIISFIIGMRPLEKLLTQIFKKDEPAKKTLLILTNLLIAFAVVLGKVQRTHSLFVFTQPIRTLNDIVHTLTSSYLMLLVLVTGLLVNLIYFFFRGLFADVHFFKKF